MYTISLNIEEKADHKMQEIIIGKTKNVQ